MKLNRHVMYAAILAVMGGITACERTDGIGQLTGPVTRQFALDGTTPHFLKRNRLVTTNQTCSVAIGKGGGTFAFDGGSITVSPDAVVSKANFCVRNHAGDDIRVDLTAWDFSSGVQVRIFTAPVKLTLDLSDAAVTEGATVGVVYLSPTGIVERVPSFEDKVARTVTAYLSHFSDYSPIDN